jgi:choline dehydrogenase
VFDSPGIGRNLSDQVIVPVVYETRRGVSFDSMNVSKFGEFWKYVAKGTGPFRSQLIEAFAFINTENSADTRPNLQLQCCIAGGFTSDAAFRFGVPDSIFTKFSEAFTIFVTLLRPGATGEVQLSGSSIDHQPLINPNYLSSSNDVAILKKGIEIADQIVEKEPLVCLVTRRKAAISRLSNPFTETYLFDYVRSVALPGYNPVGTCSMSPVDGNSAVVDPTSLKIVGLQNVRIADCSVAPTCVSGGTHALAVLIGEKVSDFILADACAM